MWSFGTTFSGGKTNFETQIDGGQNCMRTQMLGFKNYFRVKPSGGFAPGTECVHFGEARTPLGVYDIALMLRTYHVYDAHFAAVCMC